MKLPTKLHTATRSRRQRAKNTHPRSASHAGVMPQDAWCEEVCQETYPRGSEARNDCMTRCWEN